MRPSSAALAGNISTEIHLAECNRQTSKSEILTWKSILLQELLFGENFHSLRKDEKAVLKLNKSQSARCCDLGACWASGTGSGLFLNLEKKPPD